MLVPFLALQNRILSGLPEIKTCLIWNDDVAEILRGTNQVFALPAVFPEFPEEIKWDQLGGGVQIVDPLSIKLHLVTDFYDAQGGTQGQNLDVFELADKLRDLIQDWMPTTLIIAADDEKYSKFAETYTLPFGVFTREKEIQDKSHSNVYHFIQTYLTTWTDSARIRPVGGITAGDLTYELDKVLVWNDTDLYTAQTYVSYIDGNIYKCILDTVAPNTLPTNTTYFIYDRKQ